MTTNFKYLKWTFGAFLASSLMLALMFIVSCDNGDDEPDPELYEISGVYTFASAKLQTPLDVPGLPVTLPVGYDITDAMADGLLAEAPCDNPENGAVELRDTNELFFTCMSETNELKTGTWVVNSDTTELDLNLSLSSGDLQLGITDLEIEESANTIGGTIANFPITKTLVAGFLSAYDQTTQDQDLAGIPEDYVQLITVDIVFQKEE
jgi:hypothetical protein